MDAEPALGREHLCRAEMIPGRSQGFRITCTEAGLAVGGCSTGKSFGFIIVLSPDPASTVSPLPQMAGSYHKKRVQGAQEKLPSGASGRTEIRWPPRSQQCQGPQR